ncbi:hypothetical protein AB0I81_22455 [Nonomuraea sp. NPDC050404]|uniref:hypothetical protein n=1 Tax=Nonomuraea sp. NPDC050404 TaxID=3155783 RepID=UPI0033F34490
MAGKHRATGAVTEPMQPVRRDTPPVNPEPETATMPAITSDWDDWDPKRETDPDRHMEPLRHGGRRVEARMRQTFRQRGLILAKRVGRQALRLRQALAKGGDR